MNFTMRQWTYALISMLLTFALVVAYQHTQCMQ